MENTREFVEQVKNGNMKAFSDLYEYTSRQVYYTCYSFLHNEHDSMDIMQDTYISALTNLYQLQDTSRFGQWVNQIAVNKCKNFLAKKQPVYMEADELDTVVDETDENFLPESYITNKEKRATVFRIMQEKLTVAQYQTVILFYFDGLSAAEIAQSMECSVGTVTSRLSGARAKIKAGVLEHEEIHGEKLYSVAAVPFLAALFIEETRDWVIPNIVGQVLGSVSGMTAQAGMSAGAASQAGSAGAMSQAGSAGAMSQAGSAGAMSQTGMGAEAAQTGMTGAVSQTGMSAARTAASAAKKGFLASVKAKIAAGVIIAAVVGGIVAVAAVTGKKKTDESTRYEAEKTEITEDTEIPDTEYEELTVEPSTEEMTTGATTEATTEAPKTEDKNYSLDVSDFRMAYMGRFGGSQHTWLFYAITDDDGDDLKIGGHPMANRIAKIYYNNEAVSETEILFGNKVTFIAVDGSAVAEGTESYVAVEVYDKPEDEWVYGMIPVNADMSEISLDYYRTTDCPIFVYEGLYCLAPSYTPEDYPQVGAFGAVEAIYIGVLNAKTASEAEKATEYFTSGPERAVYGKTPEKPEEQDEYVLIELPEEISLGCSKTPILEPEEKKSLVDDITEEFYHYKVFFGLRRTGDTRSLTEYALSIDSDDENWPYTQYFYNPWENYKAALLYDGRMFDILR